MPEGTLRPVERPAATTPRDEPMPTEIPTPPVRMWLASSIVHHDLPTGTPEAEVKINGCPFTALLASDSGRDGESPQHRSNLFLDLYPQVTGGGLFAKDQHKDDCLKHCWTQVCVVEGKETQPGHILSRISSSEMACSTVSRSERGRKRPYWWCHGRRRRRCWSWPTRTHLPATLEWPTPPNGSVTASNGS